ncbi:MAG: Wzz/FepE/Etk N-terminal domain-containing protein [bacterium]
MPNDEISLKEVLIKMKYWCLYLISKWVIILLFGLLGGAIGYYYAFIQKPVYTATLSFALEDEKSGGGLLGAMGLASSLGIDLGTSAGGAFNGANLIELMKSRTLIERALLNPIIVAGKTSSLVEYYIEFSKLRKLLDRNPRLTKIHYLIEDNRSLFSLQKDSILGEIYNIIAFGGVLSVSQKDKKISIISVDVKTENEYFSKTMAESIVKEVSDFYIDTKSKKAKTNVAILQKQVDSIRNELNAAISGVAQASDNTFNLNAAFNIKRAPSTRRQVDVQANSSILIQLVTNLELAKVTLLKETPLIQVIDKPILPLKKEQVGKLKSLILFGTFFSFSVIGFLIIRKGISGSLM